MTEPRLLCTGLLLATLVTVGSSVAADDSLLPGGLHGRLSIGYRSLSETNTLSAGAQYVNTRLRLQSEELGARRLRLLVEGADHRAITSRHAQDSTGALFTTYDNRVRLRQVAMAVDVVGGRLRLGRLRPQIFSIGTGGLDGAAYAIRQGAWRLKLAGGRRVSFWEAGAGPGSSLAQMGAEVGWEPTQVSVISAGVWRDEAIDGTRRLRVGIDARTRLAVIDLAGHVESEPAGRLLWRIRGGWRQGNGGWRIRLDAGGQRLPLFPVADRVDSSHYGGRSHHVGTSISRRLGRDFELSLLVRSRYGERQQRTEVAHLRWDRIWRSVGFRLRLTDSWSRWRQMERVDLLVNSRVGRRWHVSTGASATAFEWRTSRASEWQTRMRPYVSLRFRPAGVWEARLRVEEQVDEFENLRTLIHAGVSCRL